MFLRVTLPDGTYEDLVLEQADPRRPIRLAVGEPRRRSSIWRVWANRNNADVYIAARVFGGIQKFSLHASGDWRYQWTSTQYATEFGADNRIIDQWTRPADRAHGHTTGLSIWVPHGHLDDVEDDGEDGLEDDVFFVPEAPEGHLAGMHVTVSAPDRQEIQMRRVVPLAGFVLAPNPVHPVTPGVVEAVLTFYSQRERTAADEQMIGNALGRANQQLRADGSSLEALAEPHGAGVRVGLFAQNDAGLRSVYEISARKISIAP
jgi:hypothetical protein